MSDIDKTITLLEFEDKLRAIEAHCKQRLPGEWPLGLDDKFIELMNDACQYFPYEIASTEVLLSDEAPTEVIKNPIIAELEKSQIGYKSMLDVSAAQEAELEAAQKRIAELDGFVGYIKSIKVNPTDNPKFLHSVITKAQEMLGADR